MACQSLLASCRYTLQVLGEQLCHFVFSLLLTRFIEFVPIPRFPSAWISELTLRNSSMIHYTLVCARNVFLWVPLPRCPDRFLMPLHSQKS
jgi:hypothetical protein